jgi:hypothetical protein
METSSEEQVRGGSGSPAQEEYVCGDKYDRPSRPESTSRLDVAVAKRVPVSASQTGSQIRVPYDRKAEALRAANRAANAREEGPVAGDLSENGTSS